MGSFEGGKQPFDLDTFKITNLSTQKELQEFAKGASGERLSKLQTWGEKKLPDNIKCRDIECFNYADYLHNLLGRNHPLPRKIDAETLRLLKQYAQTGKVERTSYTSSKKLGIMVSEGTKKFDFQVSRIDALQAAKLLAEFPSDENSNKPTKLAIENWKKYSFDQRRALQKALGTDGDGRIGANTISALKAKAEGKQYMGDVNTRILLDYLKDQVASDKATGAEQKAATVTTGAEQKAATVTTGAEQKAATVTTGAEQKAATVTTGAEQKAATVTTGAEQ